jgi:AraC-like DNA-binding protein
VSYREHPAPPALAPFVECFWTRTPSSPEPGAEAADAGAFQVLPDGCIDVIVDVGAVRPAAVVVGAMTRAHRVGDSHALELVAVRFRPGGAHAFFARPLDEWRDRHVALADAWRGSERLIDGVAAARGPKERMQALAAELLQRCSPLDAHARRAVALAEAVRTAPAGLSIAQLAADFGVTRQHLARTFQASVGLGPKMLQRIARLQRAIALLQSRRELDLAAIALEAGYADQPHFTNDSRALAAATPAELRAGFHSSKT